MSGHAGWLGLFASTSARWVADAARLQPFRATAAGLGVGSSTVVNSTHAASLVSPGAPDARAGAASGLSVVPVIAAAAAASRAVRAAVRGRYTRSVRRVVGAQRGPIAA